MNIKPLEHSSLYCIFCDDIRNELDGKTSIVGWYADGTQVLMGGVPLLLPKFSIVGILTIPIEKQPAAMTIDLLKDEEVLQSISIPHDKLDSARDVSQRKPSSPRTIAFRLAIQTVNFPIDRACTLRMRVQFDSTELYSNGLEFCN